MSLEKVKTENGQHKSRAGKCRCGRKTIKPQAKRVRRINDKKIIRKEIKEI
jgi:hypothetical protein